MNKLDESPVLPRPLNVQELGAVVTLEDLGLTKTKREIMSSMSR